MGFFLISASYLHVSFYEETSKAYSLFPPNARGYIRCVWEQTESSIHHHCSCKRKRPNVQGKKKKKSRFISYFNSSKNDGSISVISVGEWASSVFSILRCVTDCLFCWSNCNIETTRPVLCSHVYIYITEQWYMTSISCGSRTYAARFVFLTGLRAINITITTHSFFTLRIYSWILTVKSMSNW